MTWLRDGVSALRKVVLIDSRISELAAEVKALAEAHQELDRRLARLEGKFELLERMRAGRRRRLPPSG